MLDSLIPYALSAAMLAAPQTMRADSLQQYTQQYLQTTVEQKQLPPLIYDPVQTPAQPQQNAAGVGEWDAKSWWFVRNNQHLPPSAQQEIAIGNYDAWYLGDTQHKVIYLTFDEGYENGYTPAILDILKANDVHAAFFVTEPYIWEEPDLVRRMEAEGHIVGNHSSTHPNMSKLSDAYIQQELENCAAAYEQVVGKPMPRYFRPPEGAYSIHSLQQTQANGYTTIFWSFAYADWDIKKQPGREAAYQMVMDNYHNGCIMLLHAVSQSNTEALDDMIKSLKAQGYVFLSLDDLGKT